MDSPETQAKIGIRQRIDNPETQAKIGIRQRRKTNKTETNTTPKTKKINNKVNPTKSEVNPSAREGKLFMFLTRQTNNKSLVHINFIFS